MMRNEVEIWKIKTVASGKYKKTCKVTLLFVN